MRLTLFALILFNIPLVLAQNTPISLVPDVTVEHYLDIQPNVSRMVYDAVSSSTTVIGNPVDGGRVLSFSGK